MHPRTANDTRGRPAQDEKSWRFTLDPDDRDPALGSKYLAEAYYRADPDYDGGVSVPAICMCAAAS